jgi:hypothetical protein
VHVAPPLDCKSEVRLPVAVPTDLTPTMPGAGVEIIEAGEVAFALAVPVEERTSERVPIDEEAPQTLDFERPRSSAPTSSGRGPTSSTIDKGWPSSPPDDPDREALLRDLLAIGAIDEEPDRTAHREVAHRATLARSRALRFRLGLHDVWPPSAWPVAAEGSGQPLALDLALDAALLVGLADGAKSVPGPPAQSYPMPFVRPLVDGLRAARPDLPRGALRDRGAAAISRLTLLGWRAAIEATTRAAQSVPVDARHAVLAFAARVAVVPAINEARFAALGDLERALAVPTGSLARALDAARGRV